jgi:hypothetical protein
MEDWQPYGNVPYGKKIIIKGVFMKKKVLVLFFILEYRKLRE